MADQPPAPYRGCQNKGDRRQAEKLHQKVGHDCPANTERVAHGSVGGMAKTGVLDRPGRKRKSEKDRSCEQSDACNLAQSAPQRFAHGVGQKIQWAQTAIDRCHVCHQPRSATRR